MRSMFDLGFRKSFMAFPPKPHPQPKSRAGLGQDEGWDSSGMYTSYDQGPEATVDIPGLYTSIDQMPDSTGWDSSGMYTSYDQGPAAEPVANLYTEKDLQEWLREPSKDTDWGKVASSLLKSTGEGYAAYQKAQTTFDSARAKVGLAPMPLQAAAAQSSGGISPNVLFLVGGLAAVSLLVVLIRA